jgi:hypothetical protein
MAFNAKDLKQDMKDAITQAEANAMANIQNSQAFINISSAAQTRADGGHAYLVFGVATEPANVEDYETVFKSLGFKVELIRPADGAAYDSVVANEGLSGTDELIVYIRWA